MNTLIPTKLSPGDEIRIIAPSLSLSTVSPTSRRLAQKRLEAMGFVVTFGKNVMKKNIFNSSSTEERLTDWNDAWNDPNVKAIFCATGGYNTNQLLPYIDWNTIRQNPKIFCGYSDITVLINAIYAKTNLVTYHGPNFSTLAMQKDVYSYTVEYLRQCLTKTETFTIAPSPYWCEDDTFSKKNTGPWIIQSGSSTGITIGGNLCSFNLLQGTQYMPNLGGAILFIEDDPLLNDFDVEFERNLQSVLQQKNVNKLKGIVIGRFQKSCNMTREKITQIMKTKKELNNIPIIANIDFGHTQPQFTFPIGGRVNIIATKNRCSITFV